jgi:hypothetical protein
LFSNRLKGAATSPENDGFCKPIVACRANSWITGESPIHRQERRPEKAAAGVDIRRGKDNLFPLVSMPVSEFPCAISHDRQPIPIVTRSTV